AADAGGDDQARGIGDGDGAARAAGGVAVEVDSPGVEQDVAGEAAVVAVEAQGGGADLGQGSGADDVAQDGDGAAGGIEGPAAAVDGEAAVGGDAVGAGPADAAAVEREVIGDGRGRD